MERHLHQFPDSERNLVPPEDVNRLLQDSLTQWIHKPKVISKWMDIASKKLGKNIEASDLLTIYKERWIKDALEPYKSSEVWTYQNEIIRAMKTAENCVATYLHANRETLRQGRTKQAAETTTQAPTERPASPTETQAQPPQQIKETEKPPEVAQGEETVKKSSEGVQRVPTTAETATGHARHPIHHQHQYWRPKQHPMEQESQTQQPKIEHLHQHPVEKAPAKGETSKATPEKPIEEHPGTGIQGRGGPKEREENENIPTESLQHREDFPTSTSKPAEEQHPSDASKEPSKQPDDLRTMEATHFEHEPPLELDREKLQPRLLEQTREQASSDVKDLLERQETGGNLY